MDSKLPELDSADKELLRRAMLKVGAVNEIIAFLSEYFRDKYGLTPTNQITPDGRIVTPSDGETTVSKLQKSNQVSPDLSDMSDYLAMHGKTDGD